MTDRNLLAELVAPRPAANPYGNTLARLLMQPPPSAMDALPATPTRDVATMPTPQMVDSQTLRAMAMASMLHAPTPPAAFWPTLRRAMEPEPDSTYGSVLPFARDNETGAMRFAAPNMLRDTALGLVDLANGVNTGQVTPEASTALFSMATGSALGAGASGGPAIMSGPGVRYIRRSRSPDSPVNPNSQADYAMFVESRRPRHDFDARIGSYGPNAWITRGDGATDVRDIQPAMVRALRESGRHEEYGGSAAKLVRDSANPPDIVNSAGLWDNPGLVQEIYERVLEPRGITSVRTQDGLLLFDPTQARRIRVD